MFRLLLLLMVMVTLAAAQGTTYVVLWFDTEDYVDPIADDAALRIANDLTHLRVRGTFKIVGEKARVLEARNRRDVIEALTRHSIGYHSDWHSIQPVPALDLEHLGWIEGADEFQRRQEGGFRDVSRIFGITPVCYGQPGSSWAPQSNLALRRMGVHVYLDEGTQVGVNDQPIWYDGLLYVFSLGPYQIRADLDGRTPFSETKQAFNAAVERLSKAGGGLISTVYHPTEFVHTEFWDAVNFANGASKQRSQWVLPRRRSAQDAERCYRILNDYVEQAKQIPGVLFVTANDLLHIYASPLPPVADVTTLARHFRKSITFLSLSAGDLSAADILLELLRMPPDYVDGPTFRGITTYRQQQIPDWLFGATVQDVRAFIAANHRLPSEVWVGSQTLSLADFAATLAGHVLSAGPVRVAQGKLEFEKYF